MADDLLEEMDEKDEVQEIQRENGGTDTGPGKLALVKRLLSNKKRLILIAGGVLLVLALVGGALLFFSGGEEETPSGETAMMTDADVKAALEKEPEIIFEDIVVLAPFERIPLKSSSAMQYISLGLSLELTDHRYRKMVVTVEDRLRKIVQGQVREMTWLELRNPEGKIKLKYELLRRMNSIFPKVTIRNVYFTNFLMQ